MGGNYLIILNKIIDKLPIFMLYFPKENRAYSFDRRFFLVQYSFLYEEGGNIYLMFTYTFPYNKFKKKTRTMWRKQNVW